MTHGLKEMKEYVYHFEIQDYVQFYILEHKSTIISKLKLEIGNV